MNLSAQLGGKGPGDLDLLVRSRRASCGSLERCSLIYKVEFMPARAKKPTEHQRSVLQELRRAAVLRDESERLYMQAFLRAMQESPGITLIAWAANRTPQAANSMRVRLEAEPGRAGEELVSFDEVVRRARVVKLERDRLG